MTAETVSVTKLFVKIAAAEQPMVFLRGGRPRTTEVSEWLLHAMIEAESAGEKLAPNAPSIFEDLAEFRQYGPDHNLTDVAIVLPLNRDDDPTLYIAEAKRQGRESIVVDVGEARSKITTRGVTHVAVTEDVGDVDWWRAVDAIQKAKLNEGVTHE